MSSQRPTFIHLAGLGLALGLLVLVVSALPGCGGQDVTMGRGDAELIFTNRGDGSVRVTARWTGENQRVVSERFWVYESGKVTLREALKVVRLNLPPEKEIALAKESREGGSDSFKKTLERITAEQEKRGAPPGLLIVRINWGFKSKDYNSLKRFAKTDNISITEYCQKIRKEHIQSRKG